MSEWFGASWSTIGFVVASTMAMYATLLVAARLAGRRTLAQLSAFDVIITIALGTLVSSTIVAPSPTYAQSVTAIATLLCLQIVVAAARRKFVVVQRLFEFEPEVVARGGKLQLPQGLLSSQLSEGELRSQLRQRGIFDESQVGLVILEPTGKVSVAARDQPSGWLVPEPAETDDD